MYYKKDPTSNAEDSNQFKIKTTSGHPAAKSCIFNLMPKEGEELINEESTISVLRFRNTSRASLSESAPKQGKKTLERHKPTIHWSRAPNTRNTTLIPFSRSASLQPKGSSKLRYNCMTKMHPISAALESKDGLPLCGSTTNLNKD